MKIYSRLTLCILMLMSSALSYSNKEPEYDYAVRDRSNPFEMASLSISYTQFPHQKILDATGVDPRVMKDKDKVFTITLDKPVYKKYLSYELNFSWLQKFVLNDVDQNNSDPEDKDTEFPTLLGFDTYFSLRGRLPLYLGNAGDIALTGSGGIGTSTMMMGLAKGDKANKEGGMLWYRFGFVKVLSYGIDYYPVKWIGVTFEVQNRFYNFVKDTGSKMQKPKTRYKKSFNFSTGSIFVFGIKITY